LDYESLDRDATKKTFDELAGVLDDLANRVIHTVNEITPHLASMQALLSQRGRDREKVLKQAGLPTWTQWATSYAAKLDCAMRTIQDHIQRYRSSDDAVTSLRSKKSRGSRRKDKPPRRRPDADKDRLRNAIG